MAASPSRSLLAASTLTLAALLVASAPPSAHAGRFGAPRTTDGPAFTVSVADAGAPAAGDPAGTTLGLTPGGSAVVTRTVATATVPPRPDVLLLADTTGSMQGAIDDVRANATRIVQDISAAQPEARFAVAEFRDSVDEYAFRLNRDLTADPAQVQDAVNVWQAGGGGDEAEAGLNALYLAATDAVTWRTASSPIVVIFGDAPSHDPSLGHDLPGTIQALRDRGARVVAVDVETSEMSWLDQTEQFTRITQQTGGVLLSAASGASDVSNAILAGIHAIRVTVGARITGCDPQLSASVTPAERTVDSGTAVDFALAVSVDARARNGGYGCQLEIIVDGLVQGGPERIEVTVTGAAPDVPVLHSDTTLLDFGELPLGTPAPARVVTLTNSGDYPLSLATALGSQPAPAVFAITGSTCGTALAVAESCALNVSATARAIGAASAVLSLATSTDTGGLAAQSLTLSVSGRSPTLQFNPGVGRSGQVVAALGRGFPPGVPVVIAWTAGTGQVSAVTDGAGTFSVPMMVFEGGTAGPRNAIVSVPAVGTVTGGSFLVESASSPFGPFVKRR